MKIDLHIIGAGPAGVSAAFYLSRQGFNIAIYESAHKPGMKPCGRAIPAATSLDIPIIEKCIEKPLTGASLYVDGEHVFTLDGLNGYIVDRICLFEELLSLSNVETYYQSRFDFKNRTVRINGSKKYIPVRDNYRIVNATGHVSYKGEKINALQYIFRTNILDEQERIEIYFDTRLIGYYWVFPSSPGHAEVGVGGYADFTLLKDLLNKFIVRDKRFTNKNPEKIEGAQIAVGGIRIVENKNEPIRIGEAAGFVLPLTGEGIRPSLLSGKHFAEAIIKGKDPIEELKKAKIAESIKIQRKILEGVKKMKREERKELLSSVPGSLHASIALGNIDKRAMLKALVSKPRIARILLKLAFS